MELVQLLHLKMSERADVLQKGQSVPGAEPAQSAMIQFPLRGHVRAGLQQVTEEQSGGFVPGRRGVQGQLVGAVRVIIARVTPQLRGTGGRGQVLELPLVPRAALFHVVHVLQTLEMLVRLAVQLEVRLQVGFVGTKFADEVAGYQGKDLALARPRSVHSKVVAQSFQRVRPEIIADTALVQM